ncbi:HD domain-containing protein [Desulfuromonas acetoxidans]|uniref:HD domain-containing protein n=1 Tax=Desulfuromonas acetoxidans (strain DSM 684 / 11070) TaxID=281689 RepID=Q1JX51_DESA6|nr:HD domain-containing protein [Desulfuromonas acetoxidans]EAT14811.1 hypothetical protein Dace_0950 [Desulfuromonas acetoxidans DSM 684]MBF0645305.1 HD domain-containing protein [Desulfuromonas acetoxidans]NVD25826.1 phosphohydrolase [Desulfuromonas acetoxidans]NVE17804.1 phosphohydrolase [Desulfuromonas acetoxidans]
MKYACFELLYQHVEHRLTHELPTTLCHHSAHHSLVDVLSAVRRLGRASQLSGEEQLLLDTAAVLHDLGYLCRYEHNEEFAARYAVRWLPYFGFNVKQADQVSRLIRATSLGCQPQSLLEKLLCDADLDVLGRPDYWSQTILLRQELEAHGYVYSWQQWLNHQYQFLTTHHYYSSAAQLFREVGKRENIHFIEEKINQLMSRGLSFEGD